MNISSFFSFIFVPVAFEQTLACCSLGPCYSAAFSIALQLPDLSCLLFSVLSWPPRLNSFPNGEQIANGRYVPAFLSLLPPHSFLKRNALSICFLLFKPRLLFLMLSLAILAALFVQKEINHFIFKSHKLLLPFCQEDWSLSRLRNNTQICQVLSNVTFL